MTHFVIVTQKAKDDLRHYYVVAAERAPETAARWLNRFEEALQTLSTNPTRCPLAPENDLVTHGAIVESRGKSTESLNFHAGCDILGRGKTAVMVCCIAEGGLRIADYGSAVTEVPLRK